MERNKKQFYAYLTEHLPPVCKIAYYPSGYFLWIELPQYIESVYIYQMLLARNISIAPSVLFNANFAKQNNFLRINCSFDFNDRIESALSQVVECIQYAINNHPVR